MRPILLIALAAALLAGCARTPPPDCPPPEVKPDPPIDGGLGGTGNRPECPPKG